MFLTKAQCTGEVMLVGAHIGGTLNCDEAVFSNPDRTALNADGLAVDANVFLRGGAQCTGEVRLSGAQIKGQLVCSEAVFSNPDGTALTAHGLTVDAEMFLTKAQCTGEVMLVGAHIGEVLSFDQATLTNPSGLAVDLERATVAKAMHMRPRRQQRTDKSRRRHHASQAKGHTHRCRHQPTITGSA
jgi:hypothetical protein